MSGDPTFGDQWIPPLECPECNHEAGRTRVYCSTCKGPFYCNHCAGRIGFDPVPPAPDEPLPFPVPPPPILPPDYPGPYVGP